MINNQFEPKVSSVVTDKKLENPSVQPVKYARLPCRGCLASCKNYLRCDGKMWRMEI